MMDHIQRFFDFALDMFAVINRQGQYVEINPAWTKNLGWTLDEMKSLSFREFVHPMDLRKTSEKAALIWKYPGTTYHFENRYIHKNGGYRWISWTGYVDPELDLSFSVARDITEYKRTNHVLKAIQEIQEGFLYNHQDLKKIISLILKNLAEIFDADAGFLCLFNDDKHEPFFEFCGQMESEMKPLDIKKFIKDLRLYELLRELNENGIDWQDLPQSIFKNITFSDQLVQNTRIAMFLPLPRDQENFGVLGLVVPARKSAHEVLTQAKPLLKAIVDGLALIRLKQREKKLYDALLRSSLLSEQTQEVASIGGWELNFEKDEFFWTKETYRLHNLDPNLPPPKFSEVFKFAVPEYREMVRKAFAVLQSTGESFDLEFEVEVAFHRRFWVRLIGRAIVENGKTIKAYGAFQDIHERKRFENQFKTLVENIPAAVYRCKKDMSVSFISNIIEEISGYKASDFIDGKLSTYNDLILPEDLPMVQKFRMASARLNEPYLLRYRISHRDGVIRWVYERGRGTLSPDSEIDYFDGAIFDITDLMDAKARAQEIDNRMRLALSAVRMGVWDWDLPTGQLRWDHGIYEIYELDPIIPDSPEKILQQYLHPDDKERFNREITDVIQNHKLLHTAFRIIVPRGEVKVVGARGRVEYGSDGKPLRMSGVNWDMTIEHVQAETIRQQQMQMVQSAKMASLGEMASGIAHEINNPLAIIQGKASHLKSLFSAEKLTGEKLTKELDKIEQTSQRISKIIKGLRSFSRNAAKDPFSMVPVSTIVEDTFELCRERFKNAMIEIRTRIEYREAIYCRSAQISQVLLNLLNNSYDAVLNRENAWVEIRCSENQDNILIYIMDSGPGITAEISEKIMEPFFTTKEVGRGTGLGLSISKGIIEEHHGKLWLNPSGPNTCFVIQLPKYVKSTMRF